VINTQGPGPFVCPSSRFVDTKLKSLQTFNINLQGTSLGSLANEAPITFTVNTDSDAQACPQRELPRKAQRVSRLSPRKFLVTPQKATTLDSNDEVPEIPKDKLPVVSTLRPKKKVKVQHFSSQEANPGNSQQDSLADASDTEGDVTDFHNNEPIAVFSPNCIVCWSIHFLCNV
jgi:hypothetical protein